MTTAKPTIRDAMKTPMIPPVYAEDAEDKKTKGQDSKDRTGWGRRFTSIPAVDYISLHHLCLRLQNLTRSFCRRFVSVKALQERTNKPAALSILTSHSEADLQILGSELVLAVAVIAAFVVLADVQYGQLVVGALVRQDVL